MNFSVIIPTYKRQKELDLCLLSIFEQDLLPAEIIIVDDSELGEDFLKDWQGEAGIKNIDFVYYKKDHYKEMPGSSSSRNIGIDLAKNNICFILDDDLVLEKDFFSKIIFDWKKEDYLLGIGGVILNNRKKIIWEKIYNSFFNLDSSLSWDINNSGFQSWDDNIKKREKAFYVHGGVCAYSKELVKKLGGFTIFSGGREALEDLDFCWRAKLAGYYFLIEPEAKVFHAHSPSGRENEFISGFKESANRKKIFIKFGGKKFKSYIVFYWANFGWILRQALRGKLKKTLGMIKGLLKK